jgi:hypothetical protein
MPLFRMTERDLDAISAPPGDEERVAAWRSAHDNALAAIERMQLAAQQDDRAEWVRLSATAQRESDRANRLARDLGMSVCAE